MMLITNNTQATQPSPRQPLTAALREAKQLMRGLSLIGIVAMLHGLVFVDLAVAADAYQQSQAEKQITLQGTPEQQLNEGLLKIQSLAKDKKEALASRQAEVNSFWESVFNLFGSSQISREDVDDLEQLQSLMDNLNQQALDSFNQTEAQLIEKNVPKTILQRHRDTVTRYQEQYTEMAEKLQAAIEANNANAQGKALNELHEFMAPQKLKKRHQKTDPNKLPWGTPDAEKTRKPVDTPEELSALTGIPNHPQATLLAANVITPDMLGRPGGPVAEDLIETIDIQFTDAIRAKALELEEDPVKIYHWVRNNIEFIPSYGSIQGADYTLQHGKGNAFDTASLLIALLRVSNIPARYAYGTVEIPAEKVMNWVGGVDVPAAAQQLLGQGGIPNQGLIQGGKITHIKLEQVWVEAWVDYFPSRAAKHVVGDSWIPLDASFKQYEFTQGEELETNVPFDAQALVDNITQSATIDETEGFVQGVDQTQIEAALTGYQQQIVDYINNQNPEATLDEVLGGQKVIIKEFPTLPSGLPYEYLARTHNYSELPNNLRHKFRYTLGTEYFGTESSRLITFEQSLPELAGKKHALSFRPATQADEDLINSYLPEPDPITGEIDPNALPNELPGYLINLTAEFAQDGTVIHSAEAGTMGGELYETLALWAPNQGWAQAINHPVAGEYRAIGLDLQGANPEEVTRLLADIETTKTILDGSDATQVANLTKNEVLGDLLHSIIYSYMGLNDVQDKLQSEALSIVNYRLPSYGIFSTSLQTNYWFSLPRSVNFSGLGMDVDRLAVQNVAKNNDRSRTLNFMRTSGLRSSALEHVVPEQILSDEENFVQGISAVKALDIASAEGQKIWTITQENLSQALTSINLNLEIENEIRNAVLSGKIAITHEQILNFGVNTNAGYILIDPETGAGAYLIASGDNGSDISGLVASVLSTLATVIGGGVDSGIAISALLGASKVLLKKLTFLGAIIDLLGLLFNSIIAVSRCPGVGIAAAPTIAAMALMVAGLIFVAFSNAFNPLAMIVVNGIAGVMLSTFANRVAGYSCNNGNWT